MTIFFQGIALFLVGVALCGALIVNSVLPGRRRVIGKATTAGLPDLADTERTGVPNTVEVATRPSGFSVGA